MCKNYKNICLTFGSNYVLDSCNNTQNLCWKLRVNKDSALGDKQNDQ